MIAVANQVTSRLQDFLSTKLRPEVHVHIWHMPFVYTMNLPCVTHLIHFFNYACRVFCYFTRNRSTRLSWSPYQSPNFTTQSCLACDQPHLRNPLRHAPTIQRLHI